MTYKELYLKEHPECEDFDREVVMRLCPKDNDGFDIPCPLGGMGCTQCWNREVPEEKTNAFGVSEEAVVKLGEAAVKMGWSIKDSGTRREFSTGAVRDIQEGKGRCDLAPLDVIADWFEQPKIDPYPERTEMTYWVLTNIYRFQECGKTEFLHSALSSFLYAYDYVPTMFLEVAKHFEAGAAKYGEWNWQKGIPTHCYIDSAVRHYLKFLRGDTDEPHDRAFVWNILCCIWTCKHKPELNDYPRKEKTDE